MLTAFAVLVVLTARANAADPWTLTTADFRTKTVLFHGVDDHGIAVTDIAQQNARTVPLDQFILLDRATPLRTQPARFILRLSNGDRLAGEPVSFKGDNIVWHEVLQGEITVSARSAVSIRRAEALEPPSAARTEDVVTLANGDTVHGILSDLNGTGASVQPAAGGDATPVPLDSIASIEFATTAAAPSTAPSSASTFRITLADQTRLTASAIKSDEWTIDAKLPDSTTRYLPIATIQSIEQMNGPVIWLSSLTPSENIQRPYIGSEHPARFDQTVTGNPIRFGDRTFTRGIGVHAYSRLSWPIASEAHQFRTQYAIDGDLPYADVTVRILLDGVVAHERKGLRAGELSPIVNLDVSGKTTITLEVDYGKNQDVQARLNWIEPALLRGTSSK